MVENAASALKSAVIGVGYLGKFHAQKFAQIPGADLIAVVDVDREARERVAADLDKMITLELLNFFAAGEWVFCETKGDAYFADGRPSRNRYAMVWRVRAGKVIGFREYNDSQLVVDSFPHP